MEIKVKVGEVEISYSHESVANSPNPICTKDGYSSQAVHTLLMGALKEMANLASMLDNNRFGG